MEWDGGTGWYGVVWDGMGWGGMDGMGWDGLGWDVLGAMDGGRGGIRKVTRTAQYLLVMGLEKQVPILMRLETAIDDILHGLPRGTPWLYAVEQVCDSMAASGRIVCGILASDKQPRSDLARLRRRRSFCS